MSTKKKTAKKAAKKVTAKKAVKKVATKQAKVPQRPGNGTAGQALWDILDTLQGKMPKGQVVARFEYLKEVEKRNKRRSVPFTESSAHTAYINWRKANGIQGRAAGRYPGWHSKEPSKPAVKKPATRPAANTGSTGNSARPAASKKTANKKATPAKKSPAPPVKSGGQTGKAQAAKRTSSSLSSPVTTSQSETPPAISSKLRRFSQAAQQPPAPGVVEESFI